MALVRAAGRAGTRDFKFVPALAAASAGEFLVCLACAARPCGNLRGAATALVSRLVSALVAAGILLQPVHWPLRAGGIFYFHPDAARMGVALDGQKSVATQASAQRGDLLASSQRLQPIRPAVLKLKS